MEVFTVIVKCPFEGLFVSFVTTLVADDAAKLQAQKLDTNSAAFDQLRDFLCDSSAYDEQQMGAAIPGGFDGLLQLARTWGWDVHTIETTV